MLGSAVTINNMAYLIPITTNILQGRRALVRGKFHMGAAPGLVVNGVTVAWLVFAIVFFSFPYYQPVTAENMNYTCVCVGGIAIIALVWWFVDGRRFADGMGRVKEVDGEKKREAEAALRGESASRGGEGEEKI